MCRYKPGPRSRGGDPAARPGPTGRPRPASTAGAIRVEALDRQRRAAQEPVEANPEVKRQQLRHHPRLHPEQAPRTRRLRLELVRQHRKHRLDERTLRAQPPAPRLRFRLGDAFRRCCRVFRDCPERVLGRRDPPLELDRAASCGRSTSARGLRRGAAAQATAQATAQAVTLVRSSAASIATTSGRRFVSA